MKIKRKNFTLAKWIQILKNGRKFYHLADLMKLANLKIHAARKTAQRLIQKGILVKLYREFYGNQWVTYQAEEVANLIYPPSYISCETALFHYGILDQAPFSITSVTSRKSKRIRTGNNEFIYHKIHPSLFWGYSREVGYLLAEPEKALLDWLYLNPKRITQSFLDEMNREQLNQKKLKKYAAHYPKYVQSTTSNIF